MEKIIKVLIISDTHNNYRNLRQVMEREKEVSLVLHLGDLEGHDDYVRQVAGAPLEAVQGNCDYRSEWPAETMVEVGKYLIFMSHGHRYQVEYDLHNLEEMARDSGADMAMFGHTHVPYFEEMEDGFVLLNPGSLGSPRQYPGNPSYMIMEINEENDEVHFRQEFLE